ncbi:MAG: ParB/RepB/Spo0J family partition protein [Clostridiales Family XIII bacterium]|jgi:ParB family chromosome partitioning protein|nr:ParB/RepB/Spo0J family partition protein [Clostridiales Family XIII bacterium]
MAGKKQALGRGLNALFGEIETAVPAKKDIGAGAARDGGKNAGAKPKTKKPETGMPAAAENAVLYIDIDEIKPNSMQPRQSFDSAAIEELAASIETYGVIQPVILKQAKNGYELVAGERRWRAARKAGLRAVPAIVREVTSEENALIAIIENMQRENLNTVEEAMAFRTIIGKYGMTQEALAKAVGKSRPHIANTLRTLHMPPEIVDMLRTGALTLGHANALGAVKETDAQVKLAEKIAKDGLSVREAERLAAAQAEKKAARAKPISSKTNEIRIVEQELTSTMGAKVVINGNGEKGSVELRYYDRQGLEEIIELLRSAGARRK